MKRKVLAMLLALTMMSGMVACGDKSKEPASVPAAESADDADEEYADDVAEEPDESAEAEGDADFSEDISNWSAYMGMMDDGGYVYYCYSGEGDRAGFIYLSADYTKSVRIFGDYTYDEAEGIGYITDTENGVTLADISVDNGDGTFTVDLGAQGTALIAESDPQEVLDAMDTILAGTEDVTAEFVASLE